MADGGDMLRRQAGQRPVQHVGDALEIGRRFGAHIGIGVGAGVPIEDVQQYAEVVEAARLKLQILQRRLQDVRQMFGQRRRFVTDADQLQV
mgnify:CR=1 FL=1